MNGLWLTWFDMLAQARRQIPEDDQESPWRKLLPIIILGVFWLINAISGAIKKQGDKNKTTSGPAKTEAPKKPDSIESRPPAPPTPSQTAPPKPPVPRSVPPVQARKPSQPSVPSARPPQSLPIPASRVKTAPASSTGGKAPSPPTRRTVGAPVASAASVTLRKPPASSPAGTELKTKEAVAPPMSAVHESTSLWQRMQLRLSNREDWARAVVLSEILSPPLAMRPDPSKRFSE